MNIYLQTYMLASRQPLHPLYKTVMQWFSAIARFEEKLDDWTDAPAGAIYKTVSAEGTVDYWDDEPFVKYDMWNSGTGPFYNTMWKLEYGRLDVPLGYDWRLAKRSKPELTPETTVV